MPLITPIKCICGSNNYKRIFSGYLNRCNIRDYYFEILKCKKCGLAWTHPTPSVSYASYDFSDYFKYKDAHQSRSRQIVRFLKIFKKSGRILELGCGPGFLLELARDANFYIKGIELSTEAVMAAQELLGPDAVQLSDALDYNFANQYYDCIIMDNFLEHVSQPFELLIKIKNALKDDGLLVICSPNIDGLYVRFLKGESYILRPQEHIWHFSVSSIKTLLQKAGYMPIRIKTTGFMNEELFVHNLKFFRISKAGVKSVLLNSLNYMLGKIGTGDMFIAAAKKIK